MLFIKPILLAVLGFTATSFAAPTEVNIADACDRDRFTSDYKKCEWYRNQKKQDQRDIDRDRDRIARDRERLDREMARGDWNRAERDWNKLEKDRAKLRGDKTDLRHDQRRECANLFPKPSWCRGI